MTTQTKKLTDEDLAAIEKELHADGFISKENRYALLSALREAREELARVRGLLETGFSEREAAEIAMRYQRECMDAAQCRIPGPPDLPGVIRVVREARAALKGGG